MYDIFIEKPEPLVPRSLRYGVRERILDDGSVLRELDEEQVRSVAAELEEREVGAVAVSFLHGFRNPAHERRVAEILAEEAPEVTVSLSSEVSPEIREYERTSTTICNVYVRPLVERYLQRLEERLRALGIEGSFYIMLSNGGTASVQTASRFPMRLTGVRPRGGRLGRRLLRSGVWFSRGPLLRYGRNYGQSLRSGRWRAADQQRVRNRPGLPVQEGIGLAGEDVGNRDDRDRRRRRLNRPRRRSRLAQSRTRERRRRSRTGMLRPGRR